MRSRFTSQQLLVIGLLLTAGTVPLRYFWPGATFTADLLVDVGLGMQVASLYWSARLRSRLS
jgi:ABC-type phosphate transport system auxiliary subunit